MVEVTLMLHDAEELALVHNLILKLEDRRRAYLDRRMAPPAKADVSEVVVLPEPTPATVEVFPEQPTAEPTHTAMADAIRTYATKHGLEKARAILNEYNAQRIGDVPAEKKAEVYARLTA